MTSRIEILLKRAQPGKSGGVKAHIKRGNRIARRIEERWHISEPYQFKAKHLQWFLKADTASLSLASRYDYWRTACVIAAALGHWPNWEPHLRGPWTRPTPPGPRPGAPGGRPKKLAQPRS
ncbi:hypothetical protein [Halomonas piscis]|uniref:hypothetical protein n=1 Tax=Halomonas piscis TaxID=3031727 RepID=UPI0028962FAF|nr:hypothetical protein [Halomonas piscis]